MGAMNAPNHRGLVSRSFLFVLVAALAAGLGLLAAQHYFPATVRATRSAPAPVGLKAVRLISPARTLPDYRLTLSDGSPLTAASLRGHWTLVFLGFTHCPDVCPTTLASLAKAQNAWKPLPKSRRPRVLFVSVDPERDSPKIAGEYARFFHPDTLAATADPAVLADFAQSLGLVFAKVPLPDGGYTMDHSATLVLLDPQGRQAGLLRAPWSPKDIGDDLRRLTEMAL
jgi:protein SCO1/2